MNDLIILYSTGCPKCRILKKKMDEKGIKYIVCTDMERMIELGFTEVPVLEVKGKRFGFAEAVNWINQYEGVSDERQY